MLGALRTLYYTPQALQTTRDMHYVHYTWGALKLCVLYIRHIH